MPEPLTVAVVGCGRAGGAIALALQRTGHDVAAVWSRSRTGRRRAQQLLDVPVLPTPADTAATATVVVVAVPDDAIADVAAELVPSARGRRFVHTSGSVSVDALGPLADAGARVGSLHPLQTLPDARAGADALSGAPVAVTCEDRDRRTLRRVATAWGGVPFDLPDDAKPIYHSAAVFASNYLVAAIGAATDLLALAGVPKPERMVAPLAAASVDNATRVGPARALTGPIVRGDLGVVRRHMRALKEAGLDEHVQAYRGLARLTGALAGADPDAVRKATA